MKLFRLPWSFVVKALSPRPLVPLAGLLLGVVPLLASAQSVTFAGSQRTLLPLESPSEIVLDSAGDLFIGDPGNNEAVELPRTATGYGPPQTLPFSGPESEPYSFEPYGIAVDSAGDVFIVDTKSNYLLELPRTSTGYGPQITLLTSGLSGPDAIAMDSAGDMFISNYNNGQVMELPLTATGYGILSTLPVSGLNNPLSIAADSAGDVFIADLYNDRVVELPKTATGYGPQTNLPLTGLGLALAVAVDSAGDVFVGDETNVGRITELPRTTTGYGPQTTLPISSPSPSGIAVDNSGDVFVTDNDNGRVTELQTQSVDFESVNVCPPGQTAPAPCSQTLTLTYNVTQSGTLGAPKVLTGGVPNLDFTLATGNTCAGALAAGSSCVVNVTFAPKFAGSRPGAVQIVDGSGNILATTLIYGTGVAPQIAFDPNPPVILSCAGCTFPDSLATDAAGNAFIGSDGSNEILELPAGGGTPITLPFTGLSEPTGGAIDGAGDVIVSNLGVNKVVELPGGGAAQITLPFTGLSLPIGTAVDGRGNIFIADAGTGRILELPFGGSSPTTLPYAALSDPAGIGLDAAGDLFVADDYDNNRIVEFPVGGAPVTLPFTGLNGPVGVAVDAAGDVYVAENHNSRIVELPAGSTTQTTLLSSTSDYEPVTLALDPSGDLFVIYNDDTEEVQEAVRSLAPALHFASTNVGDTSADSPQSLHIQNTGNATLSLSGLSVSTNFAQVTGSGTPADCTASSSLAPGAICNLSVSFAPATPGPITGTVTLIDNSLNGAPATQVISLSGTGTGTPPTAQVSASLLQFGSIAFGSTSTLPLTVKNVGLGTLTVSPSINGQSYTLTGNTCTGGVTAGNSCTLQVQFSPSSVAAHNDILTLQTNGPSNPAVNLQGVALGVSAATSALQFGSISFGASEMLSLTLTNTAAAGTVTLGATTTAPSYIILATAQNTCQSGLAAGHSCTLPIKFSPTVLGPHNDYLNLTFSADAPPTAFVSLNGSANGVGTQLATPLNFGTIPYHTTAVLPLTVTNFGVAGTVMVGTAINGPSFKVLTTAQNTCLAGIANGQSCILPVEFVPSSAGNYSELLTLSPSGGAAASVVHLDGTESAP